MIKVGLTGGIGSGKSTVAQFFELLGVPIYYADDAAKRLMVDDLLLRESLINILGKEVYDKDNQLDRAFVSSKIFSDKSLLEQVNAAVHPAVERDFKAFTEHHKNAAYIIKEAAILIESGAYKAVDKIILVTAPEDIKLSRVANRDGASAEEVRARMQKQWTDNQKQAYADYLIVNDEAQLLIPQIIKLHTQFNS